MEYSTNFNFALPSRDNDVDLADINEISNNFRKIDENAVIKEVGKGLSTNDFTDEYKAKVENALTSKNIDQTYLPESKNAQSGVAVEEAISDVQNNVANAIKGTESGNIIQVDDVSPITHNVSVSVRRKNLFDVSKIETNPQKTIVNNGDGTITVKTASNTTSVAAPNATLRDLAPQLKVGKMYTLSANTTGEHKRLYFKIAGINRPNFFWNFGKSAMMTEDLLASNVFFYASGPSTTATISEIQIEEGETATEYEPYIDPSTATLTRCGKNILGFTDTFSKEGNGLTINYDTDKQIFTINGTPTKGSFPINFGSYLFDKFSLPIGTNVALSIEHISGTLSAEKDTNVFFLGNSDSPAGKINNWLSVLLPVKGRRTLVSTANKQYFTNAWVYIGEDYNVTFDNYKFKVQLEIGTEATDYKEFIGTKYTPTTNETVEVLSLAPTMTLLTNTGGVIIDCKYNKDTNKVIENLVNAIISLGGNV